MKISVYANIFTRHHTIVATITWQQCQAHTVCKFYDLRLMSGAGINAETHLPFPMPCCCTRPDWDDEIPVHGCRMPVQELDPRTPAGRLGVVDMWTSFAHRGKQRLVYAGFTEHTSALRRLSTTDYAAASPSLSRPRFMISLRKKP